MNSQPKRPLTQRLPLLTISSYGVVVWEIWLPETCKSRRQPTPQNGQVVATVLSFLSILAHSPSRYIAGVLDKVTRHIGAQDRAQSHRARLVHRPGRGKRRL